MPYSLSHLQHTAHYIVNRCQYTSGESLTASAKRHIHAEVVLALCELARRDTVAMVINPGNTVLSDLFSQLTDNHILFPKNTTYIIKSAGASFEKIKGERTIKIYDCQEVRHDHSGKSAEKYRAIRDDAKPFPIGSMDDDSDIVYQPPILSHYERRKQQKSWSKQRTLEREEKFDTLRLSH